VAGASISHPSRLRDWPGHDGEASLTEDDALADWRAIFELPLCRTARLVVAMQ
jgi:hypothetical protein